MNGGKKEGRKEGRKEGKEGGKKGIMSSIMPEPKHMRLRDIKAVFLKFACPFNHGHAIRNTFYIRTQLTDIDIDTFSTWLALYFLFLLILF